MHIPMLVYVLVTAHLVGDWWLQAWSTQMSLKKSSDNWWLSLHVALVGATLAVFVGAWAHYTAGNHPVMVYVFVNMTAHWATDYVTSRLNTSNWYISCVAAAASQAQVTCTMQVDDQKRFRFWTGIGTDQWIHAVTLFATAEWLLR